MTNQTKTPAFQHLISTLFSPSRLLDRTGLITTQLRPTFFAEWLKLWRELRDDTGYLRLPFGQGRHAPIAAADQARVIAAVLAGPEPHDDAAYALHGPVELHHYDIVQAMSATLGIPAHYEPISVEESASAITRRGLPEHLIQHLSNVAVDYQNGVFAGTNDNVEKVSRQAPLSVDRFVIANRSDFDSSRPNFVPALTPAGASG